MLALVLLVLVPVLRVLVLASTSMSLGSRAAFSRCFFFAFSALQDRMHVSGLMSLNYYFELSSNRTRRSIIYASLNVAYMLNYEYYRLLVVIYLPNIALIPGIY